MNWIYIFVLGCVLEFSCRGCHASTTADEDNSSEVFESAESGLVFRFGAISDLDKASIETRSSGEREKKTGNLLAYLREGTLFLETNPEQKNDYQVKIVLDDPVVHTVHSHVLKSQLGYGGRGMELSTLTKFNNKLYSCDDRTGVIYELPRTDTLQITPIPWVILADGNNTGPKGFKCEWATVKDGNLLVGGHGMPFFSKGVILNYNAEWIKIVTPSGGVTHHNWADNYKKIADAVNIHLPGYITHESGSWSDKLQKWVFMPRKISGVVYDDYEDEKLGNNTVFIADENFDNIEVKHIGDLIPTHGFSSFKFIPQTNDFAILAIKSVEVGSLTQTYIMAFDLSGRILVPETLFDERKYEGLEFL